MPELPEVETVKRRLQRVLPGLQVVETVVYHPKSLSGRLELLQGSTLMAVERQAKQLRLRLNNQHSVLVHLKMTGQLIVVSAHGRVGGGHPTADWVQQLPSKHTRVSISLSDGSWLHFNDQRLFGWLKVLPDEEVEQIWQQLAPDIDLPLVTSEWLAPRLARRRSAIKKVLLDGTVVSGLGNIYVCEALHLAQIHPWKNAAKLSLPEISRLVQSAQHVIQLGIEHQGTTFDGQYVTADGLAGGYQDMARVYGRSGLPCPVCGTQIEKAPLAGRGTYFCPKCQPTQLAR